MSALAEDHGELVHDAARGAGENVLGLLADECLFYGVERDSRERFHEGGESDFQRGAAAQTSAFG